MNCVTRRGRGILVAFEGCDRSGKSTQCQMLVEYLKSIGRDVAHLRFPGNCSFCKFLRPSSVKRLRYYENVSRCAVRVGILLSIDHHINFLVYRFRNFLFLFMLLLICFTVCSLGWYGSKIIQNMVYQKNWGIHFWKIFFGSCDAPVP